MIFAGSPIKIIAPSFAARGAMLELREAAGSQEKFLDNIWRVREPIAPTVRGSWPIARPQIPEQSVVPIKQRASR